MAKQSGRSTKCLMVISMIMSENNGFSQPALDQLINQVVLTAHELSYGIDP